MNVENVADELRIQWYRGHGTATQIYIYICIIEVIKLNDNLIIRLRIVIHIDNGPYNATQCNLYIDDGLSSQSPPTKKVAERIQKMVYTRYSTQNGGYSTVWWTES